MNINVKFLPGDECFYLQKGSFQMERTCTACEGTGHISLKDELEAECPMCLGKGKELKRFEKYSTPANSLFNCNTVKIQTVKCIIEGATEGEPKLITGYYIGNMFNIMTEDMLFATRKEMRDFVKKSNIESIAEAKAWVEAGA